MWIKRALETHPDKGGDAADFRALQESFDVVRDLFDKQAVPSNNFSYYFAAGGRHVNADGSCKPTSHSNFDWFEMAAKESVPGYKVEVAKSGR